MLLILSFASAKPPLRGLPKTFYEERLEQGLINDSVEEINEAELETNVPRKKRDVSLTLFSQIPVRVDQLPFTNNPIPFTRNFALPHHVALSQYRGPPVLHDTYGPPVLHETYGPPSISTTTTTTEPIPTEPHEIPDTTTESYIHPLKRLIKDKISSKFHKIKALKSLINNFLNKTMPTTTTEDSYIVTTLFPPYFPYEKRV